jgi:hypothetical protein
MEIQIVSAILDPTRDWWEVIKLVDGKDFNLHTIPAEAFAQWSRRMNTEDPALVLDAIIHAPLIASLDPAEIARVKTAVTPKTKLHMGELQKIAKEKGLDQKYYPVENPLAPLEAAAKKGIKDAKVLEVLGRLPGGAGGSNSIPDGSVSGRERVDPGVADSPGSVPPGNRRRVGARQQAHDRGPRRSGQQES